MTPQHLARAQTALDAWQKVVDAADERERAELANRMPAASVGHPP
ncbi:hypothetical protein ACFY0R_02945 [Streptomyces sp. NPDC001633]